MGGQKKFFFARSARKIAPPPTFKTVAPPLVSVSLNRHSRPVASLLLTGGGRFPQIVDLFQRLKVGVASGCLRETSIFKIIIIDDVILWSKLEYTWLSLLDFINFIRYSIC